MLLTESQRTRTLDMLRAYRHLTARLAELSGVSDAKLLTCDAEMLICELEALNALEVTHA